VVLLVVVAVLQAGFLDRLALTRAAIKPNLLLIILVFFSLNGVPKSRVGRRGGYEFDISAAIISSFSIGFVADLIVMGSAMGIRMISFGTIGTLLAYLNRLVAVRKSLYQSCIVLIAGLLVGLVQSILMSIKAEPVLALNTVFWSSVYSAVLGPFFFPLCAWWLRMKTSRFSRY